MKKKAAAIFCCILTGLMVMTGCGSSSGTYQIKDGTITGTVDSIDEKSISLTLSGGMGGGMQMGDGQTPPDKPDGDDSGSDSNGNGSDSSDNNGNSSSDSDNKSSSSDSDNKNSNGPSDGQQGQMPDGQAPGGEMPDGNGDSSATLVITVTDSSILQDTSGNKVALDSIEKGDMLTITIDEDGEITKIQVGSSSNQNQNGSSNDSTKGQTNSYTAVKTYTKDTTVKGKTIKSTGSDENATLTQNNATVTLNKVTVSRLSENSSGGDSAGFYGVGAAVLTNGGTTILHNSKIKTKANGGAGVFSYGEKSESDVSNTTIETSGGTSGGLHVAGGGTLNAWNCTVSTEGESSAAIRSDRGGGKMVINGGRYTSNGTASPAVYCTADITVNKAELTANKSEGICLEGANTLRLYNCDVTSSQTEDDQNDNVWNMILYQSTSGDAEEGKGSLSMSGGSLTAKEGGLFYTTNTESEINLSNVDISYPDNCDYFLRCTGNKNSRGWGQSGANGADCTFTADDQEMKGDIVYDSISNLDFYMIKGSRLTGAVIDDESCAGDGGKGKSKLVIDSDSTWVVTGDSELSKLSCEGKIIDSKGKNVTIKGDDGSIYVKGDSTYTITVGKYSDQADTSGAGNCGEFKDYKVEKK